VTALDFPGIGTLPEYRRIYPNNAIGGNVVGYVGRDGNGLGGLEYSMNAMLSGRSGWQRVEISRDGQHIPMGEDQTLKPVPGRGLRLTLLRDLQYKAQAALQKQVRATHSKSGSVIVMDPHSGQILAMATAPGFDPNALARADPRNLGNRAVAEAFEPGSTNKVITAAGAIEKGGVTPGTVFTVPDRITRMGRTFHDSHPHRVERLTFGGVLAKSSNVGTIMASERISRQTLYDFLRSFGFGAPTGVRLPGETSGMVRPPAQWSGTDRYPIAFGQTVSVNALQMASVYATIANGGVRVTPNIVAGTTDEHGGFVQAAAPVQHRVISTRTAREIIHMLEGVTTRDGTAPAAQIPGYRVAGKTGTARIPMPSGGYYTDRSIASFIGFLPASSPQVVIAAILDRPSTVYGGVASAPLFQEVARYAIGRLGIEPGKAVPLPPHALPVP
jgi:cell division protein FtsI (penicillin-binding protein 3)